MLIKHPNPGGFHLIEILITLALITILTSAGLPLYTHYFVEERRLEATHALCKLAIAMEHFYVEHNTYQEASLAMLHMPTDIANHHYQLFIESATDNDYIILAKPLGQQAEKDRACGTLGLNALGEKSISGSDSVDKCW